MSLARSSSGFTLVETLVSMVLALIVFGATLTVLEVFQRDSRFDNMRNEAQDSARTAIDALSRELRNGAAPSSTTPGALEKAGKYSIVFQTIQPGAPVASGENKNVTNAIRVRYCLNSSNPNNEVLWKQTIKWTSEKAPELPTVSTCPDLTPGDYEKSIRVAQNIVNRNGAVRNGSGAFVPLFTYIPANWTSVFQITGVEPNIYLDVNPHNHPGETQLTSSIDLRNENRLPTAAFTATEVSKGVVKLNGTQSTDPDGLALSYKWWDNGKALSSTSSETESGELTVGSEHTFKLEVSTPSGLKASSEAPPMKIA